MVGNEEHGWHEYRRLVVSQLEELLNAKDAHHDRLARLELQCSSLARAIEQQSEVGSKKTWISSVLRHPVALIVIGAIVGQGLAGLRMLVEVVAGVFSKLIS